MMESHCDILLYYMLCLYINMSGPANIRTLNSRTYIQNYISKEEFITDVSEFMNIINIFLSCSSEYMKYFKVDSRNNAMNLGTSNTRRTEWHPRICVPNYKCEHSLKENPQTVLPSPCNNLLYPHTNVVITGLGKILRSENWIYVVSCRKICV